MSTTITDPRITSIEDPLTLELSVAALEDIDIERWENLESVLGTSWTKEMVEGPKGVDGKELPPSASADGKRRLRMPLLVGMKPEIINFVQKHFHIGDKGTLGDGSSIGEEAQSMFEMPKEQFLALMGQARAEVRTTGKPVRRDAAKGGFKEAPERPLGGK